MQVNPEWEFYIKLVARPPRLVMRQKIDGEWQYREPTPEETAEYLAAEAW